MPHIPEFDSAKGLAWPGATPFLAHFCAPNPSGLRRSLPATPAASYRAALRGLSAHLERELFDQAPASSKTNLGTRSFSNPPPIGKCTRKERERKAQHGDGAKHNPPRRDRPGIRRGERKHVPNRRSKKPAMPQLVNTRKAAEILGRSAVTLKRWRAEGVGPNWIELQGRVSYDVSVLLE